jgi:sulfopyruvate decarboxylase subunit alpha
VTAHAGADRAAAVATELAKSGFGPFYVTPDGLQAPMLERLAALVSLTNVVREDIAIALGAGAYLGGRSPVVLMQNSGLGQSVNVLASLVQPYGLAMLLVVGLRGTGPDATEENLVMGRMTPVALETAGIPAYRCVEDDPAAAVAAAAAEVSAGRTAAVLIPPDLFGWEAVA